MATSLEILQRFWGHQSFRAGQEEVIESVLSGRDTLALLPTGGGKSICYQVPTLVKEGLCIVVSPLIALMADQVDSLKKLGIKAESLDSTLTYRDKDRILDNCIYGDIRFLFISPERLDNSLFLERLQRMKPVLFAIDEAHCISQWGYDFRPAYLKVACLREVHSDVPMLALTATATPEVISDIQDKLAFSTGKVITQSYVRENIAFSCMPVEDKRGRLIDIFSSMEEGVGIVYVRNRRLCRELSDSLNAAGINSSFYHAGMKKTERASVQERFMQGDVRVMVATNAFGMGINKGDVRIVAHYGISDCIESYYQEAGRAGRDGQMSKAIQLYSRADADQSLSRIEDQFPSIEQIKRVYQSLADLFRLAVGSGAEESFGLSISELSEKLKMRILETYGSIKLLEANGYLALSEGIRSPSRLQFTCDQQQLSQLMTDHKSVRKLLEVMLRSYSGIFSGPVVIQEEDIASRMKVPVKLVEELLARLDRSDILDYFKRSGTATVYFPIARVRAEDIVIHSDTHSKRRDRLKGKQMALVSYVEDVHRCRSSIILDYFGESGSQRCGHCDNCLRDEQLGMNSKAYVKMLREVRKTSAKSQMEVQSMHQLFDGQQANGKELLRWSIDNGFILNNGLLLEWNEKRLSDIKD